MNLKVVRIPHFLVVSMQGALKIITKLSLMRQHQKVELPTLSAANDYLSALYQPPANNESSLVMPDESCDVTVIIPCYNCAATIAECVQSVLNQAFTGRLEVIVVNDGSTDDSATILSQMMLPSYVQVITQKNAGLSASRNSGLARAHGRYLFFLDGDDRISDGALQKMWQIAETAHLDLVDGHFRRFNEKNSIIWGNLHEQLKDSDGTLLPGISGFATGKLFRRSLWQGVNFPQGYWFEDTCVIFLVLPRVKRYRILNSETYEYRENPAGISRNAGAHNKTLDTLYLTQQMIIEAETKGIALSSLRAVIIWQLSRFLFERLHQLEDPQILKSAFCIAANIVQERADIFQIRANDSWYLKQAINALFTGDYIQWCHVSHSWMLNDKIAIRG